MARDRKAAPEGGDPLNPTALGFEEAIERLQTIVEELEGGSLSLEESIARYEEGVRLSRRLTLTLDEAERRIERLTEDATGEPVTEPMELKGEPGAEPRRTERPAHDTGKSERRDTRGSAGELPF